MAIKRESKTNKFDSVVEELNAQETKAKKKTDEVVKTIVGKDEKTKIIEDKNGRIRRVKVTEKRKTLPVYIPMSLYEKFDKITTAYGMSNNAAICQLIRDYVSEKKDILEELQY